MQPQEPHPHSNLSRAGGQDSHSTARKDPLSATGLAVTAPLLPQAAPPHLLPNQPQASLKLATGSQSTIYEYILYITLHTYSFQHDLPRPLTTFITPFWLWRRIHTYLPLFITRRLPRFLRTVHIVAWSGNCLGAFLSYPFVVMELRGWDGYIDTFLAGPGDGFVGIARVRRVYVIAFRIEIGISTFQRACYFSRNSCLPLLMCYFL